MANEVSFPLYVGRGMMTAVYSDDLVARRLVAGQIRYIERIWVRVPAGGEAFNLLSRDRLRKES